MAALVGLVLIIGSAVIFDGDTPFPGRFALIPTLGTLLVILFASGDNISGRILGNRIFVGVGLVSYSAYLWHQTLFAYARMYSLNEPGVFVFVALSALALVLAYLTWRFVEMPFRRQDVVSRATLVGVIAPLRRKLINC